MSFTGFTGFTGIKPSDLLQGPGGRVTGELASIDTGEKVVFTRPGPPSTHTREFGAQWDEAGVAEADVQPLEYRHTQPERRTYKITLDGRAIASSVEGDIVMLRRFTKRVPGKGKVRAHKCIWTQGAQRFRCIVESVQVEVSRIGASGLPMQAEVSLTLKEIDR